MSRGGLRQSWLSNEDFLRAGTIHVRLADRPTSWGTNSAPVGPLLIRRWPFPRGRPPSFQSRDSDQLPGPEHVDVQSRPDGVDLGFECGEGGEVDEVAGSEDHVVTLLGQETGDREPEADGAAGSGDQGGFQRHSKALSVQWPAGWECFGSSPTRSRTRK